MVEKKYWKYFDELKSGVKIDENKQKEFLDGVTSDFDPNTLQGITRRKFLALSAATLAVTTTACTNYRDKGAIVPYNSKPENVIPGIPNYYASTCTACSNSCGILIKTVEGRPIKIDGNPDNRISKGKICSIGQANILNLYHPERYKKPLRKTGGKFTEVSLENALSELLNALDSAQSKNQEIAIISSLIYSPTLFHLLEDFQIKYPTTKIYTYEYPFKFAKLQANELVFGNYSDFRYDLSRAKVIVSVESNFLATDGNFIENIRNFTKNRNVDKPNDFNQFYAFESDLSLTGANADYRYPTKPNLFLPLLYSLINEILQKKPNLLKENSYSILYNKFKDFTLEKFAQQSKIEITFLNQLVDELIANYGKAIVISGDYLPREIHIATHLLNKLIGGTDLYLSSNPLIYQSRVDDFYRLSQNIKTGRVGAIINLNTNFVFHFPDEFDFSNASKNVPIFVTFTESESDTSVASNYVLPKSHNFESWGDYSLESGKYSTQQPVIEPIFGTYQIEDILLALLNGKFEAQAYHKYLIDYWKKEIYPRANPGTDFQTFWHSVIHDGFVEIQKDVTTTPQFNWDFIDAFKPFVSIPDGWSILFKKSYNVGDGSFVNNGWLMELPHPISKVTWENYASISEKSAHSLSLRSGSIVRIEYDSRFLEIPVFITPGLPDNCLVIELGFGQDNAGIIGSGAGFNATKLLSLDLLKNGLLIHNAKVSPDGNFHKIASTVEHHSLNDTFVKDLHKSRHIIQEGSVQDYINGRFKAQRADELISIIPEIKYTGVKWAMVIDLNKCIGCGVCITACNVENNIPIVGKEQVSRGREMQWIRIDTYFSGIENNLEVALQPMLCQHCDNAPCENVCPVVATNHSPDGLNQMVYNRCVGTRYCSNNCPYKVRRFNFYDYRDHFANGFLYQDSIKLLNNPEVTVRSRGVMEKCTFCIQRISFARQQAANENRKLKGSDVKTACQEACPSDAIIFGDMHDKDSELFHWRNHKLGYYVLEDLNVKPNVTYIARLRNKRMEEKA